MLKNASQSILSNGPVKALNVNGWGGGGGSLCCYLGYFEGKFSPRCLKIPARCMIYQFTSHWGKYFWMFSTGDA